MNLETIKVRNTRTATGWTYTQSGWERCALIPGKTISADLPPPPHKKYSAGWVKRYYLHNAICALVRLNKGSSDRNMSMRLKFDINGGSFISPAPYHKTHVFSWTGSFGGDKVTQDLSVDIGLSAPPPAMPGQDGKGYRLEWLEGVQAIALKKALKLVEVGQTKSSDGEQQGPNIDARKSLKQLLVRQNYLDLANDSAELEWELVPLEDDDSTEDQYSNWLAEWHELDSEDGEMDSLQTSPVPRWNRNSFYGPLRRRRSGAMAHRLGEEQKPYFNDWDEDVDEEWGIV